MRALSLIFIALGSNLVFAADYMCAKTVADGHTEFAEITIQPLQITTSYQRCTPSGDVISCESGTMDVIASSTEICGFYVGSKGECVLSESNVEQNNIYRLEVNCTDGTQLLFQTFGKSSEGEISCSKDGKTTGYWNVGTCTPM